MEGKVKQFLSISSFVEKNREADILNSQRTVAILAAVSFLMMSLMGICQKSLFMLILVCGCAFLLLSGWLVSVLAGNGKVLKLVFYIILLIALPAFTITGGISGFAALWLIPATYVTMQFMNFKIGFLISCFYLLFLCLVFMGPLSFIVGDTYSKIFLIWFPFFFAISFVFDIYMVVSSRRYQYQLIVSRQELEKLSVTDLSTDLQNRNGYIKLEENFYGEGFKSLAVIYIDVNALHEINNLFGHDKGDHMLRTIADEMKKTFPEALHFRMGGDEFLVICENVDELSVNRDAQKMSAEIGKEGYSIALGVEWRDSAIVLDDMVRRANERMRESKAKYYSDKSHDRRHHATDRAGHT